MSPATVDGHICRRDIVAVSAPRVRERPWERRLPTSGTDFWAAPFVFFCPTGQAGCLFVYTLVRAAVINSCGLGLTD